MSTSAPPAPSKKNIFFRFFAVAVVIWVIVIGVGTVYVVVPLLKGTWSTYLNSQKPADTTTFNPDATTQKLSPDAAAHQAIQAMIKEFQQPESPIKIEEIPGQKDTFKLTEQSSGQTLTLNLAELQKTLTGGDPDALTKLFSKTGQPVTEQPMATDSPPASVPAPTPPPTPTEPATPATPVASPMEQMLKQPMPDWLTLPEGISVTLHVVTKSDTGTSGTLALASTQSVDDTANAFEEKLKTIGCKVERTKIGSEGNELGISLSATQDSPKRTVQLTIMHGNTATQIAGTYSTE
jgi:hypothetical protein